MTVADPSSEVAAMQPAWELAGALLGGTTAMRNAGATYLPKWPKEDHDTWLSRKAVSVLFPAYKRTVETLTGKPFSKPVTVGEDVPPIIAPWLMDIDLQGRNLDVFLSDQMETALGYGLSGILVEFPTRPEDVRTLADERQAGLRPYWVHIKPTQILGWRAQRVGGEWRLMQLRFMRSEERV